jgi:hypothetical protein
MNFQASSNFPQKGTIRDITAAEFVTEDRTLGEWRWRNASTPRWTRQFGVYDQAKALKHISGLP